MLVTVVDEFAVCGWIWPKIGASSLGAVLLDYISDIHELVEQRRDYGNQGWFSWFWWKDVAKVVG